MGLTIDQTYTGLDPAVETAHGGNTARRLGDGSIPAKSQPKSADPEMVTLADAVEMENALEGINEYLTEIGSSLSFIHDEASGRSAVQVLDEGGNVIRQVPPQELLDVYAKIRNIVGILLDESG